MTLSIQFMTMISMIAGGIFIGASVDTFDRILCKRNKRSWLELIYQLGFWLFQAAFLFYILYLVNYGELRVYVFIAIICGFAAYRALFQNFYLNTLELLIKIFTSIFRIIKKAVYYFVIWPIKSIIFLIISLLIVVYKILLKGIFLMFIVVFYPIKLISRLIWRLVPKNMKKYLRHLAGFFGKIKNTMSKRINKLLNK